MNDHVALALNDTNFRTEVLESSVPVLVDFWAPWCPPCQKLAPTIEELTYQYSESARVGKIDVDVNPESASTYRITSIPAVLIFKDRREVDRIIGLQSRARYEQALRQAGVGD